MNENNKQSRKWLITINNPKEKNLIHYEIKAIISSMKSIVYYVMADEIGGETQTYHTHVFLYSKSGVRFSTIKNHFPSAHIDLAKGTAQENKDYITKSGKWEGSEKQLTKLPDTFEEFGEMPIEHQGVSDKAFELIESIKSGVSTKELLESNPSLFSKTDHIIKARQVFLKDKYSNVNRNLVVKYIYGNPKTGKTRYVMDNLGYDYVYRVTHYSSGSFDGYEEQEALLFDNYNSQFPLPELLSYLDGFPGELPARYSNRCACYSYVFIISNIPLYDQYLREQSTASALWEAFLSRIDEVLIFTDVNAHEEFPIDTYIEIYGAKRKEESNGKHDS